MRLVLVDLSGLLAEIKKVCIFTAVKPYENTYFLSS